MNRRKPLAGRTRTIEAQTKALDQLVWLRDHKPSAYDAIMVALGQLVAAARAS